MPSIRLHIANEMHANPIWEYILSSYLALVDLFIITEDNNGAAGYRYLQKAGSVRVWEIIDASCPRRPQSTEPHLLTGSVCVHNLQWATQNRGVSTKPLLNSTWWKLRLHFNALFSFKFNLGPTVIESYIFCCNPGKLSQCWRIIFLSHKVFLILTEFFVNLQADEKSLQLTTKKPSHMQIVTQI